MIWKSLSHILYSRQYLNPRKSNREERRKKETFVFAISVLCVQLYVFRSDRYRNSPGTLEDRRQNACFSRSFADLQFWEIAEETTRALLAPLVSFNPRAVSFSVRYQRMQCYAPITNKYGVSVECCCTSPRSIKVPESIL